MTTSAQLRLMSDLRAIKVEPPEGCSASPLSEENLFVWGASILGPMETAWEGGVFQLRITFGEHYPDKPPRVRFTSEVFHPNVYNDGTLCLDIIQEHWSPCHNICSILTSIQSLLTDPNCASPANPEAAQTFLTNDDLAKLVDTSDEWIASRTGIKKRHILAAGESLSSHAAAASLKALEMAGVNPEDVDLVVMATSSPDDLFGSATAVQASRALPGGIWLCDVAQFLQSGTLCAHAYISIVTRHSMAVPCMSPAMQAEIGATKAAAFDLTAACSGFVMALVTGAQFIRAGTYKNVVVIGADALSRYIDWRDRSTCILFGDGCGAVVLSAKEDGSCGLLGLDMHSDGKGMRHLNCVFAGEGMKPLSEGQASDEVIEAALVDAKMDKTQIDWLVMHQANMRIMSAAADRLGVPPERVVSNLAQYGNTSAASIPLALDEAVRRGDIKPGEVLAMAGFGAGLSWASAIVRWG
ncbi:3-oxoacyl-[acyl-carrier-protein] synthase 3 [Chlorella vulgaris]